MFRLVITAAIAFAGYHPVSGADRRAVPAKFECRVISVYDGDGPIHCANGIPVRIAGIQAPDFERAEPCRQGRRGYVCDDAAATRSRDALRAIVADQILQCRGLDRSYARVVAECRLRSGRSIGCVMLTAGAAWRLDVFWQLYGLGRC